MTGLLGGSSEARSRYCTGKKIARVHVGGGERGGYCMRKKKKTVRVRGGGRKAVKAAKNLREVGGTRLRGRALSN